MCVLFRNLSQRVERHDCFLGLFNGFRLDSGDRRSGSVVVPYGFSK